MKTRSASVALAAAVALTFVASPASAATVHYDYPTSCYDVGSGQTACYTTAGHYNATTTPSGNYVYTGTGHSSYSIFDATGAKVYDTAYDYQYNYLVQKGVTQTYRMLYQGEYESNGQTCEVSDNYLFANGTARHRSLEVTCA